ncbi:MAG: helix-turn-helix transcriptional regulator [Desulfobacteraceae bacterium]
MSYNSTMGATNKTVAFDIGRRLKNLRLSKNYSQKEIAERSGLSLKAIQNAKKGDSKLLTYIKILRALNSLASLESFIPEITISPLELARMEGKKRIRASGTRKKYS